MPRQDAAAPGGHITFIDTITRRMLRGAPAVLFVFVDNLAGAGLGGQAREMRGEPNAVGLPTKRRPARDPGAYFTDADLPEVQRTADPAINRLRQHLAEGGSVVWPAAGIGTGRADLQRRAPAIAGYYEQVLVELSQLTHSPLPGS
jgi:hypothetical protein